MDIRILPSNIANMIAAGEVVQRPASVVKELMENAVDAGASQVTVVIKDAGRTLVQVIDNGCGMSPDEAVICFERHATSKIASADDLLDITTFGFRGEALASIAAVAEVSLKTRREEDELGCEVRFADSKHLSTDFVATPKGSNFAIRNLFYNVPARRKFLKSDTIEFKHIVNEFTHVALTRPEIGFTLRHNDKDIFVLKPAMSLKFRIQNLLGSKITDELVDVGARTSIVNISGFVGKAEQAKKGLGNQYFFVNGRFFRSPYLHKAVMKAYENLIPEGVTPSYFLYLEVDPHCVDVNIHPTKTEIKFENDSEIFQAIFACIRQAIGRNSYDSIDFQAGELSQMPVLTGNYDEFRPIMEPGAQLDPNYNPFENDGFPNIHGDAFSPLGQHASHSAQHETQGNFSYPTQYGQGHHVSKDENYGKLFEDRTLPAKSVIVLGGKYLLANSQTGLMVVNIRRARERILYEKFIEVLSRQQKMTQTSLFPVTVQVGVENMLLFEENSDLLSSLGFDISAFGTDTIVVNGVPDGYSAEPGKVQSMVYDLLVALSDDHMSLDKTMEVAAAEKFARLGACGASPITSSIEAQRLLDELFACQISEYTSSGHRVISIVPVEELDKRF